MTCNLDEEVMKTPYNYPYIAMVHGDSSLQFFVVAERVVLCENNDFVEALIDLVCVYFVFNIVYPKPLYPVFLFLQHYVLGIKDRQPIPAAFTRVLNALK